MENSMKHTQKIETFVTIVATIALTQLMACGGNAFSKEEVASNIIVKSDAAIDVAEINRTADIDAMTSTDDGEIDDAAIGNSATDSAITNSIDSGVIDSGANTDSSETTTDDAAYTTDAAEAGTNCSIVCLFADQGSQYVNHDYTCSGSCLIGDPCSVTNTAYGTTFSGTIVCE
jgi:hypothetical protein